MRIAIMAALATIVGCTPTGTRGTRMATVQLMSGDPYAYDAIVVNAMRNDTVSAIDYEACRLLMREVSEYILASEYFPYVHVTHDVMFDARYWDDMRISQKSIRLDSLLESARGVAVLDLALLGYEGGLAMTLLDISDYFSGEVLASALIETPVNLGVMGKQKRVFEVPGGWRVVPSQVSMSRKIGGPLAKAVLGFLWNELLLGPDRMQAPEDKGDNEDKGDKEDEEG